MRVAIVSTYPPRRCGLATFTTDLLNAVLEADSSVEVVVAAVLDDSRATLAEPGPDDAIAPEVLLTLRQHERADYARAAQELNETVDVVLVQHEYGIFGGEAGEYVLDLLSALTVPYVVTLHTLLLDPSPQQRAVLRQVVAGAAQVTVFTALARDQLVRSGLAPWSRIAVVNHGAPEALQPFRPSTASPTPGIQTSTIPELAVHEGRRVLSTFGLLSASKGLEVAIRAMRTVADRHPDALYVVAGRTHPEVLRHEGERYREGLQELTAELGLQDHVLFLDRYLSDDDIRDLLSQTEVFVTPYRHVEQVVSGVLTFALVAGCPVVSTPYFYATELLSTGAGRLVGFDDADGMAAALVELLGDVELLREASRTAYRVGSHYTWPEVGRETTKVLATATSGSVCGPQPVPRLSHLMRLVDPWGIAQHAVGTRPDPATGYCVDDVARLGLVAAALARRDRAADPGVLDLVVRRCVAFVDEAWDDDSGQMRNLRDDAGRWLDEPHPGDHLGRAIWMLGDLAGGRTDIGPWAHGLLRDILDRKPSLRDPRSAAFAVLGLARLPSDRLEAPGSLLLRRLARDLAVRYTATASPEWEWFEDELTYDNGRLAQALIAAGASQRDAEQLRLGLEALEWYCGQCRVDSGTVVLVGNRWRHRDAAPLDPLGPDWDEGDEQCLDAAALVEACVEAYRATGSPVFAHRARHAFAWFHGRNRWGLALYDERTGGCRDGVGPRGLNHNQGAESTLAYLQAWLALDSVDLLPLRGEG